MGGKEIKHIRAPHTPASTCTLNRVLFHNSFSPNSCLHRIHQSIPNPSLILALRCIDGYSMGCSITLSALHGPCRRVTETFLVAVLVHGVEDSFGRAGANVDFIVAEAHFSVTTIRRSPYSWAGAIASHGRVYRCRRDGGRDEDGGENG